MLRDSFTDASAPSGSITGRNVLLGAAPNTCGCELGDYRKIDEMCLAGM